MTTLKLRLCLTGILCVGVILPAAAEPDEPIQKILFVGDSITFHAPSEKLGWSGKWGMAASSEAKDYVHQLSSLIQEHQGAAPELIVQGVGGGTLTSKLANAEALKAVQADLVVIQMGENDKLPDLEAFRKLYEELVVLLQTAHPRAKLVCTSVWRGKPGKDDMIRQVCRKYKIPFADIAPVFADLESRALSTGLWADPGVSWHPGDKGMEGYAKAIWAALQAGDAAIPAAESVRPESIGAGAP